MTDFFILAGGYGKRAEPLTFHLPKPLFPLNGKPLLSIIIDQMKKSGLNKGFVNVHHLASSITGLTFSEPEIQYIKEKKLSGNRILAGCRNRTSNNLLVINGDTFLDIPVNILEKKINTENIDGIIVVRKKDGVYSSIIREGDTFKKRDKDPVASNLMYAGVSIFKNEFLYKLKEENLFDSLETSRGRIGIVEYKGHWSDLGTPENYFISERRYRELNGIPYGNSLSPGTSIGEGAEVLNSIIWTGTKIKGNVLISESIVTNDLVIDSGEYNKKIITKNGVFDLRI